MARHVKTSDQQPAAASPSAPKTDGVQENQSGATTDEAKAAADKVAAEQAAAEQAAHQAQRVFFGELARRERAAVQAFGAFLEALPLSVPLTEPVEGKRLETLAALRSLDDLLGVGLQMIGAADVA